MRTARLGALLAILALAATSGAAFAGPPGYEPAYYNGTTVTINAIELQQKAPEKAQADFFEIVYPTDWQQRGLPAPQCNPCDHENNGIDPTDYHDHVLDSTPQSPGHGEFTPLWHVYVVVPAYSGDAAHDDLVGAALAARLPVKSEADKDALLAATLTDGSPAAIQVDTGFYFLCAVVNGNSVH